MRNKATNKLQITARVIRPITEEERAERLHQKQPVSSPNPSLEVIRMNSTFLELADTTYRRRGVMMTCGIPGLAVIVTATLFGLLANVRLTFSKTITSDHLWEFTWSSLLLIAGFLFIFWLIKTMVCTFGDWSQYTHYPMRLNRQTRKVHVFREDGTILTTDWDTVLFTMASHLGTHCVRGLILKDPETVEEVFVFGHGSVDADAVLPVWEFIRRYMEEGPQAVINTIKVCMPIADRRETFHHGYLRLRANWGGDPFFMMLMWPVDALMSLGRWISMKLSKIPYWPKEVDDACVVEPNDPYVRDSRQNMEGYR